MTNLAYKTVTHGWRRYLPVIIAVGVAGLMMVIQVALAMGAASLAAAPVRLSQADLWVGPTAANSLDESQGLGRNAAGRLWLDPDIARIEPYDSPSYMLMGEKEESGKLAILVALDVTDRAMLFAKVMPQALRDKLREPGSVALGRADARNLGLGIGDRVRLGKQSLRIVGLLDGVRSLFGVQLMVSPLTARDLQASAGALPSFYMLGLRPGADADAVTQRLMQGNPAPEYRVWTAADLATQTVQVWAFASGAGMLFIAASAIALVITLMVVSQTLGAAVAGAIREYAALRAYGIGYRAVQRLVMKQGLYVCIAALLLTAITSALMLTGLKLLGVPTLMPLPLAAGIGAALAVVVGLSNLLAVRRLRHADPASLLR